MDTSCTKLIKIQRSGIRGGANSCWSTEETSSSKQAYADPSYASSEAKQQEKESWYKKDASWKIFNPLMPNRYFCTSISFVVFKKETLQTANIDPKVPLVPKTRNIECQNLPFPLQIKPVKLS